MKEPEFMKNWGSALESYGTPGDFADKSFIIQSYSLDKREVPLITIIAPGYSNRAELMNKQREQIDERKKEGLSPRWKNDGSSCFLCDNVGQAREVGNNLLLPFDSYTSTVLLPNRYAAVRGHALIIEKEHQKNGKPSLVLSPNFLATATELSEKYNLSILRNHPKSGMSIPGHDHFHSYPQVVSYLVYCDLNHSEYNDGIFNIKSTRFDTLAFKGRNSLENILKVVRGLEKNETIFTLYYHPKGEEDWQGTYFLTPHITPKIENKGGGAGLGMYLEVGSEEGSNFSRYNNFIEIARKHIYAKGQFDWGGII